MKTDNPGQLRHRIFLTQSSLMGIWAICPRSFLTKIMYVIAPVETLAKETVAAQRNWEGRYNIIVRIYLPETNSMVGFFGKITMVVTYFTRSMTFCMVNWSPVSVFRRGWVSKAFCNCFVWIRSNDQSPIRDKAMPKVGLSKQNLTAVGKPTAEQ